MPLYWISRKELDRAARDLTWLRKRYEGHDDKDLVEFLYANLSTIDEKLRHLLTIDTAVLAASTLLLGRTLTEHRSDTPLFVAVFVVAILSAFVSATTGAVWVDHTAVRDDERLSVFRHKIQEITSRIQWKEKLREKLPDNSELGRSKSRQSSLKAKSEYLEDPFVRVVAVRNLRTNRYFFSMVLTALAVSFVLGLALYLFQRSGLWNQ